MNWQLTKVTTLFSRLPVLMMILTLAFGVKWRVPTLPLPSPAWCETQAAPSSLEPR